MRTTIVCTWCMTAETHVCAAGGAGLSDALLFWARLCRLGTEAYDAAGGEGGAVREAFREQLRERMTQAASLYAGAVAVAALGVERPITSARSRGHKGTAS